MFRILLCRFESEVYTDWTQSVGEVASTNLEKPLLVRNSESHMIAVNFDPRVRTACYESLHILEC